jgi:hypothetical protein
MAMETDVGKVYVVHNEWIQNPEAGEGATTYKVGMTTATVNWRALQLGVKMPGEFLIDCAYEFDGNKYREVEKTLHKILSRSHVGGEWFDLDDDAYEGVKSVCELAGGKLVTEAAEKKMEEESEGGEQDEVNPVLEKIVSSWNAASDMKVEGKGAQRKRIHINEIGGSGRGTTYYFKICADKYIRIGLRCSGRGWRYPAVNNIFQENIHLNGFTFGCKQFRGYDLGTLSIDVPLTTDVNRVVEIMKSLIEATKERVISGWGKE